jgi:hypothetical protein
MWPRKPSSSGCHPCGIERHPPNRSYHSDVELSEKYEFDDIFASCWSVLRLDTSGATTSECSQANTGVKPGFQLRLAIENASKDSGRGMLVVSVGTVNSVVSSPE